MAFDGSVHIIPVRALFSPSDVCRGTSPSIGSPRNPTSPNPQANHAHLPQLFRNIVGKNNSALFLNRKCPRPATSWSSPESIDLLVSTFMESICHSSWHTNSTDKMILAAIKDIPKNEEQDAYNSIDTLFKFTPKIYQKTILAALSHIPGSEKAQILYLATQHYTSFNQEGAIAFFMMALCLIPPSEREATAQFVVPIFKDITDKTGRVAILNMLKTIPNPDRAVVLRRNLLLKTPIQLTGIKDLQKAEILCALALIPPECVDKGITAVMSLFELLTDNTGSFDPQEGRKIVNTLKSVPPGLIIPIIDVLPFVINRHFLTCNMLSVTITKLDLLFKRVPDEIQRQELFQMLPSVDPAHTLAVHSKYVDFRTDWYERDYYLKSAPEEHRAQILFDKVPLLDTHYIGFRLDCIIYLSLIPIEQRTEAQKHICKLLKMLHFYILKGSQTDADKAIKGDTLYQMFLVIQAIDSSQRIDFVKQLTTLIQTFTHEAHVTTLRAILETALSNQTDIKSITMLLQGIIDGMPTAQLQSLWQSISVAQKVKVADFIKQLVFTTPHKNLFACDELCMQAIFSVMPHLEALRQDDTKLIDYMILALRLFWPIDDVANFVTVFYYIITELRSHNTSLEDVIHPMALFCNHTENKAPNQALSKIFKVIPEEHLYKTMAQIFKAIVDMLSDSDNYATFIKWTNLKVDETLKIALLDIYASRKIDHPNRDLTFAYMISILELITNQSYSPSTMPNIKIGKDIKLLTFNALMNLFERNDIKGKANRKIHEHLKQLFDSIVFETKLPGMLDLESCA